MEGGGNVLQFNATTNLILLKEGEGEERKTEETHADLRCDEYAERPLFL